MVFVGDSLVHRSAEDHGLLDRVRTELVRRHPGRAFELVDRGVNGNRIADIRDRLDQDVLDLHPHAVVLYWDSDVSDVDESSMAPGEVRTLREAYESDLREVLRRLVASGAHVVVSGPTLIGERPRGRNPKDAQLDAYRAINRRVAAGTGAAYADTRRPFFARRPRGASPEIDHGLLTEDGEHLNDRGVEVALTAFVDALDRWIARRAAASAPDPQMPR